MVKKVIVSLVAGMLLVSLSGAVFGAEEEVGKVNKRVVLPIELKDPLTTQVLALSPVIGPLLAARYVGTDRLQTKIAPEIASRAGRDALINVGTILGGILIAASSDSYEVIALGSLLATFGPIIENYFFGSYYVKKAIEFNTTQYERFHWESPAHSYEEKNEVKIALLKSKF